MDYLQHPRWMQEDGTAAPPNQEQSSPRRKRISRSKKNRQQRDGGSGGAEGGRDDHRRRGSRAGSGSSKKKHPPQGPQAHSRVDDHMSANVMRATRAHAHDYVHERGLHAGEGPDVEHAHSRVDDHMSANVMGATRAHAHNSVLLERRLAAAGDNNDGTQGDDDACDPSGGNSGADVNADDAMPSPRAAASSLSPPLQRQIKKHKIEHLSSSARFSPGMNATSATSSDVSLSGLTIQDPAVFVTPKKYSTAVAALTIWKI